MNKNIVILVMSPFNKDIEIKTYTGKNSFSAVCCHTNETALKYIKWQLAQQQEKISDVYALVSESVKKNTFAEFVKIFAEEDFKIHEIDLQQNGNLSGSFKSISSMFDVLKSANDNFVVHADMTGGFRHSSMLLLDLLQMLQYIGAKIGIVTYTNSYTTEVEEAGDLVALFTLFSGAAEFANYGNVEQIKRYFATVENKSAVLLKLLDKMEEFSERIKVSSNLADLQSTIRDLDKAIIEYKGFLNTVPSEKIGEQEEFFGKLLPTIEKEYTHILASEQTQKSIPEIIKWCINKGLLQQALTFYTEWLPLFMISSGIIKINDKNIIKECEKNNKNWSNWETYFFKTYHPGKIVENVKVVTEDVEKLSYKQVRMYLKQKLSVSEINNYLNGSNSIFKKFIDEIVSFKFRNMYCDYVLSICNLPEDNILKQVLKEVLPHNTTFNDFIKVRLENTGNNIDEVFLEAAGRISKKRLIEIFDLKINNITTKGTNISHKKIFKYMLSRGKIESKMPEEELLNFINDYSKNIVRRRNRFNHAKAVVNGKGDNYSISSRILENITNIEKYLN